MPRHRVALATAKDSRELDVDLPLALDALHRVGVDAQLADWRDPVADWAGFDLVVVRSCWDYTFRLAEFLTWVASVPRLANPAAVIAWNTDKRYLVDLAAHGVPVVPTVWNPLTPDDLPDATEWVVKPNVSAGSRDTARWPTRAQAIAHARQLVDAGRHAMVQPYLDHVDTEGETALLFFGGNFSHAARKAPLLRRGEGVRDDVASREGLRPRLATPRQRAVAESALDAVRSVVPGGADLLYARVDLIPDADGQPLLLELEITEPSLFLPQDPGAPDRFAAAVLAALAPTSTTGSDPHADRSRSNTSTATAISDADGARDSRA